MTNYMEIMGVDQPDRTYKALEWPQLPPPQSSILVEGFSKRMVATANYWWTPLNLGCFLPQWSSNNLYFGRNNLTKQQNDNSHIVLGSIPRKRRIPILTPPTTNMDTQNNFPYLKGDTFQKPSFLVSMLNFGGGTPNNHCCKMECDHPGMRKPLPRMLARHHGRLTKLLGSSQQFIPIAVCKPKKRPGKTKIKHSAHPWKTTISKRKSSKHHLSEAMLLGVGFQPIWNIFGVKNRLTSLNNTRENM